MNYQGVLQSMIMMVWVILFLWGCSVATPELVSEAPAPTSTLVPPMPTATPLATREPTYTPTFETATSTLTSTLSVDVAKGTETCAASFTILPNDNSLPPQTLASLLTNLNLPSETLPLDILKHQIIKKTEDDQILTLYWMLDNGCTFWLVYMRLDKPPYPLYLLKFDKASQEWSHQVINDSTGQFEEIKAVKNFYLIDTHLNPSASITIILPHDMKTYHILEGYIQAIYDDDVMIYGPNQIHFAPTHPTEIGIYNPFTQETKTILPQDPAPPLWAAYVDKMSGIYDELIADDWCARNNHHCRPEWFTRYFRDVTVNSTTDSLAFVADFVGEGPYAGSYELSNGQILSVEDQQVVYIYRGIHFANQLEYREFEMKQLRQVWGENFDLAELLEKETIDQLFKEE